eukprot:scaffold185550_cov33-Tisochrysis_lutea.AAC.4
MNAAFYVPYLLCRLYVAVFLEKVSLVREAVSVENVEKSPELAHIILQRCPGQQELIRSFETLQREEGMESEQEAKSGRGRE